MKELKVISLENGVILSENLVKGSILPRTSAELERDVLIQNDTIVEGAVYARKLEIQNGDVEILGAVFTKLEFHISNNAKGDIILRKTVATSDSLVSYARDCRPMFMADINGKTVKLCNAFVAGSIFADEVILEDCIVLGGVFATAKLTMKDCIVGTFNAKNVAVSGDIKLLLPSAFSGEEMQVTSEARLFNLSLADLGALYKGTPEMENTEFCERIAFEGFHDHKFIKQILSKDTAYNLTHVLCTFQEEPEWLTPVFVKKHNIKVFYLNRIPYVLP